MEVFEALEMLVAIAIVCKDELMEDVLAIWLSVLCVFNVTDPLFVCDPGTELRVFELVQDAEVTLEVAVTVLIDGENSDGTDVPVVYDEELAVLLTAFEDDDVVVLVYTDDVGEPEPELVKVAELGVLTLPVDV